MPTLGTECERCQEYCLWEDLRDGLCLECAKEDEESE